MMESTPYQYRLRQYQKAYCSTMDWKTAVIQLHEAVIKFARHASVENDAIKRFCWETRALQILNYLTENMKDSKIQPGTDTEVCDRLIMVYHACSIYLLSGEYQEVLNLVNGLLRCSRQ